MSAHRSSPTRGRASNWAPVAGLFLLGVGHVSLAYTMAGLRCQDVALRGEVLSVPAYRVAMLATTALAAVALVVLLRLILRRRVEDAGDAELAGFIGSVLGGLLAAYLLWSIPTELVTSAVC